MTVFKCVKCDSSMADGILCIIYKGNSYCSMCYTVVRKMDGYVYDNIKGWRAGGGLIPDKRLIS